MTNADVVFDGNTFCDPFCIELPIIYDTVAEPVEHFLVSLSCSSPMVTLDEESFTARVSITSPATISPGSYTNYFCSVYMPVNDQ